MAVCSAALSIACLDGAADDDPLEDAAVAPPPDAAVAPPDVAVVDPPDAAPGAIDAAPEPADAMPAPVSFSAEVVPILLARCGGCHLKDTAGSGMLSLGVSAQLAYAALVDQDTALANPVCGELKRVDSNNPDPMQSSLYVKITGATCGKLMPAGMMAVPLEVEQIQLIGRWIAEGAQDN